MEPRPWRRGPGPNGRGLACRGRGLDYRGRGLGAHPGAHTLTGCPLLVRRRLWSSVSMPKATKGPVAMSPQYPRAATRSPRWESRARGGGRGRCWGPGLLGSPLPPPHPPRSGPGRGVDTHVAQEAPRRQSPVGHLVGAGVSELKGDARVPPAPELAGVDDAGLRGARGGGRERGLGEPCTRAPARPPPPPAPGPALTPRSCSFMCRSQSLTPRRAS